VPLSINSAWLKPATIGQRYRVTLRGAGGKGTRHWAVTDGQLPAGLKLSSSAAITGTPTAAGTPVTITLTDSASPADAVTRVFDTPINP
jgi:large repetitive protein